MDQHENYVHKKEIDWSVLTEGLTLPVDKQVIFGRTMGRFLEKGETKQINLYLDGKQYKAQIRNIKFNKKYKRKHDILQIRYPKNGELANALKEYFIKSYSYISNNRMEREAGSRKIIRLPETNKEYLVIYTTEYDDTYILEPIINEEITYLKDVVKSQPEIIMESYFNYDIVDDEAMILNNLKMVKIRKLNRKIGDNLKLLYDYRCQICGKRVGEDYGTQVVEAHHIDYFVSSLNNDFNNQLIICPNHHSIIHDTNPDFNYKKKVYVYPNGFVEGLALNLHV